MIIRQTVNKSRFNPDMELPYNLRQSDFEAAMQDIYDFFYDVNTNLVERNLSRLDDMMRPAAVSGLISDMLTEALAKHSRTLTVNQYFNGHPDLVVKGKYPHDKVESGEEGVEIKSTRKRGGAVDTHGGRRQWMCVFVYEVDDKTEPAFDRAPLTFREIYLGEVEVEDFRSNQRNTKVGTPTATLHANGIAKLRQKWIYRDRD